MQLSKIIVGTMRWGRWGAGLDTTGYLNRIHTALEAGLDSFDLADIYGDYTTEAEFGDALAREPQLRSKVKLVSKCGIRMVSDNRPEHAIKSYDSSASHIRESVETSLKNLHTDYLDVLLLHRPDYLMDPVEAGEEIGALKREGKIRAFGLSNFSASQVSLIQSATPVAFHQVEASVLYRNAFSNGQLDQCLLHGIRPMAWSPLGGGKLFGKRSVDVERLWLELSRIGEERGARPEQIALAWLFRHPAAILPVIGTSNPGRIRESADASAFHLSRVEWYAILKAASGADVA